MTQDQEKLEQLSQRLAAAEKRAADAERGHARADRTNADLAARCTDLAERVKLLEAEQSRACPQVCGDMRSEYRRRLARAWKTMAKAGVYEAAELQHQLELAQDDLRVAQVGVVPVANLGTLAQTWGLRAAKRRRRGAITDADTWDDAIGDLATLIAKHAPAEDEQPSEPVQHPLRIGDRVVVRWDSGDYEGAVVSIDERSGRWGDMAQRRFALILLRSRAEEMREKAQAATHQIPGPIGEAVAQAHRDAACILTVAADRLEAEP